MNERPRRSQHLDVRDQAGSTLVLVVSFVMVLFGFAALAIDIARVYKEREHEQFGTDAAAYAGVTLLTNASSGTAKAAAIQEATDVAGANGVTASEITSGGSVQVGQWTNSTFTADATPYNAVRVAAKRTVGMTFAKVVGQTSMSPGAHSIADLEGLGSVDGGLLIPFGVTTNQIAGKQYGDIVDTGRGTPGNWQKIDLCGVNMSDPNNFVPAMVNGVLCQGSVGDTPNSGPGNAGVNSGFDARLQSNPIVLMPVVDAFGNGIGPVDIVGFMVGQLISAGGNGSSWSGQIQILSKVVSGLPGGQKTPPFAYVRVLVQ